MNDDPPNPYRDATLRQLHQLMNQRAGELLNGEKVSRRDLAHLLIAAALPLSTGESSIGSPTHRVRAGVPVDEAFWPEYESDMRAVRHHTFSHAREAAEVSWPEYHTYTALMRERGTPIGWEVSDESDFRRSLRQLQDIKELRANGWGPPRPADGFDDT